MANKNRKFADGVQVPPVSRAELRAEARKIRKWLKIEDVDYLPVPRLLEVLQALLDDFEFFICEKPDLPKNTFASYVPSVHCVVIKEAFYDMAAVGTVLPDRQLSMKFHITFFIAINWDVLHEKKTCLINLMRIPNGRRMCLRVNC